MTTKLSQILNLDFQHYEYEISNSFQKDCEKLLLEFENKSTFSFKTFATIWRSMSFTLIFGGEDDLADIKLLTEIYFFTIKKFIVFPRSLYTQVGGLYLLYGLYFKQPIKQYTKIRVTLEEYRMLTDLIDKMKTKNEHEPVFIFTKLKLENAFEYVATMRAMGVENSFVKRRLKMVDDTFDVPKSEIIKNKLDAIVGGIRLKELDQITKKYEDAMQEYKECNPQTLFTYMKSNICTDIKNYKNIRTEDVASTSSDPGTSGLKSETVEQKRRRIRKKAFGKPVKSVRSKTSTVTTGFPSGPNDTTVEIESEVDKKTVLLTLL